MATNKLPPKKVVSRNYDEQPVEECSNSVLGTIYENSNYQYQRMTELNNLVDELVNYLGLGSPEDCAEKLAAVLYGRLEEIRESQNRVFSQINDMENNIYILRRALM